MISKKKKFLYNKNNPNLSYNVYKNDKPENTIKIKYKDLESLKKTILNLEKLYKSDKYSHKRISQVALIIKVRLKIIYDNKNKLYKKAKYVKERLDLAINYLNFLKKRTIEKNNKKRKLMKFNI